MAVFTEQELMQASDNMGASAILENAVFIKSGTQTITPKTVAVVENTAVQAHVVRFADVDALAEEYGISYLDAMSAIVEANELDPEHFVVAVDEAEIITNPDIVNELANVVIAPQSEKSFAYQFCEAMVDGFAETDEESFLEAMVDDEVAANVIDELSESLTSVDEASASDTARAAKNAIDNAAGNAFWRTVGKIKGSALGRALGNDSQQLQKEVSRAKRGVENAHKGFSQQVGDDLGNAAAFTGTGRAKALAAAGKNLATANKALKIRGAIDTAANNKGKIGAGLAAAGLGALALKNKDKIAGAFSKGKEAASGFDGKAILKQAAGKDKNWIGKKVASLRSLYSKWLAKANAEKDAGRANAFKRVAASIMNVIDALLKKLEGSVGSK